MAPPKVADAQGRPAVHPQAVVLALADAWAAVWVSPTAASESSLLAEILARCDDGRAARLPLLTLAQLRRASAAFSARTSTSADGFHPRHFSWMPDSLLECWAVIWGIIEDTGAFPDQIARVLIPLIPKAEHGLRPIASFVALYRVASRARKAEVDAWARAIDRPAFSSRAGGGAIDQVWRQAARAEGAVAHRKVHGAVVWDIVKMFDRVPHGLIARRALDLGCPPQVVRAALMAYRLPRFLRWQCACSRAVVPSRGVTAGFFVRAAVGNDHPPGGS